MPPKQKTRGRVISQQEIAPAIFDLCIETELAQYASAGQFVGIYPKDGATLLPRPISVCEADRETGKLRLVYRIAGKGTAEFASYKPGVEVSLLGILGNGFPLEEAEGKQVALLGGGIGIPPLLELAKGLCSRTFMSGSDIFLGYRDNHLFLQNDLEKYGTVHIATEDGSVGTAGNVLDALFGSGLSPDVLMACGPLPMLRAIKAFAAEQHIKAFLSLEERMACGIGACLGCVCRTKATDPHSHVNNARICTEGPVFEAGEVEI